LLVVELLEDWTQMSEPSVTGLATLPEGGVAVPLTLTELATTPSPRKHCRVLEVQLKATPPQSESVEQPRCAWPEARLQELS